MHLNKNVKPPLTHFATSFICFGVGFFFQIRSFFSVKLRCYHRSLLQYAKACCTPVYCVTLRHAASCWAAKPTGDQRQTHPTIANRNLPLTSTSLLFSLFLPIELLPWLAVSRAGTTEICWRGIFTVLQVANTCLDALYLHSPWVAHLYNCSYPCFAKLSSK